MDWFLQDIGLRRGRVKYPIQPYKYDLNLNRNTVCIESAEAVVQEHFVNIRVL